MDNNIAFNCGTNFIIFLNSFLQGLFIYPIYITKGGLKYLMANYFWDELFLCINLNYFKVLFFCFILLFGYLLLV
jgi:hypothetical protein